MSLTTIWLIFLRNETTLQHTYAKILIENLLIDWLPTLKTITGQIAHLQGFTFTELRVDESGDLIHVTKDLSGPEFSAIHQNIQELWQIHYILVRYNRRIINHIRQFAPSLYDQNLTAFQQYVPTERPEPKRPDIQNIESLQPGVTPPQLGVKLKWKGDKTDLAEVVYALYKSERITDTSTGKEITKKLLAKQMGDLFGIDLFDMETPMKGRKNSNKAHYDGKTFTRYLAQLVDNFIKIT